MPELPEVETICRALSDIITNKHIQEVSLSNKNLRFPYPIDFIENLKGQVISNISRRDRYILIEFQSNIILLIHLGMTGKFSFCENQKERSIHDHLEQIVQRINLIL